MSEDEGIAAFERVLGALEAVPWDAAPRVPAQPAAAFVRSIARRDSDPARKARFERLAAAGYFDLGDLTGLSDLASATWHCRREQEKATALTDNRIVAEPVAREAKEVRARMLKVLEYHFADDERLGPKLAYVRSGTGTMDLANDLQNLALLYEDEQMKPILEDDVRFYDPADVAAARRLAGHIFESLGVQPSSPAERWSTLTRAALSLLIASYEEVAAAGRFVFRKDEDVLETYPPLLTAIRKPRRCRPADDAPPPDTQANDEDAPTDP